MLIKNGTIFSPANGVEQKADLRITDDVITDIGILEPEKNEIVIDATSCIVAPGLVDVHVHFRDPGFTYKEDLHTGALSSAAGGFTSVICMANTRPVIDNTSTLSELLKRAKQEPVRIHFAAAVSKDLKGKELTDFSALAQAGACGFTDDGIPLLDEKLTEAAMKLAKDLDLPLSFHEEDPAFIEKAGTNRTAPAIAEDILVARDCMLALHTGACINIQHISSANSVALVRTAKALGANIFAEATPHHFSLTEDAVKQYGTYAKMNPPLRTEADRRAIIEGLKDGTIDLIATDHAPHSTEEKKKEDFFSAPSGIIGLETSLALGITNLVQTGELTLMQLLRKMTVNPAKLYHIHADAKIHPNMPEQTDSVLDDKASKEQSQEQPISSLSEHAASLPYGMITKGAAADLVIFHPTEAFTAGHYQSKSENTPFTGIQLHGKVKYTICRGEIVWKSYL